MWDPKLFPGWLRVAQTSFSSWTTEKLASDWERLSYYSEVWGQYLPNPPAALERLKFGMRSPRGAGAAVDVLRLVVRSEEVDHY